MATVNASTMFVFDHWTDGDLVRAMDCDPANREEYLTELRRRVASRHEMQDKISRLVGDLHGDA